MSTGLTHYLVDVVGRVADGGGVGAAGDALGGVAVRIVLEQFGMGAGDCFELVGAGCIGVGVVGCWGAAGQAVAHFVVGQVYGAVHAVGVGESVLLIIIKALAAGRVQVVGDGFDIAHVVLGIGAVQDGALVHSEELVIFVIGPGHGDAVAQGHGGQGAKGLVGDGNGQGLAGTVGVEHH